MTDREHEIEEAAIAAYRAELVAEAELAHADVAELEDHLRVVIDELRASGLPAAQAVTEAARRLGEPRAVAREHARVRTPFGARLSRLRAYSVVALMLPLLLTRFSCIRELGPSRTTELCFDAVLALAMTARLTWARPILLGAMAIWATVYVGDLNVYPGIPAAWLVVHAGLLAFLVPWRRGEITAAGAALALNAFAFGTTTLALRWGVRSGTTWHLVAPTAAIAFFTSSLATAAGLLRARWSSIVSAMSAVTLAMAASNFAQLHVRGGGRTPMATTTLAIVATGAVATAVAAVLAWKSAGSRLGTLRHLAA
jgi:hypothetical protein